MENKTIVLSEKEENGKRCEVWKFIPNTENRYEVSNLGRIRNSKKLNILKPRLSYGYEIYFIWDKVIGKSKGLKGHRVVMLAFNPIELPNEYHVNHIDFNRRNNKLENLEWVKAADNNEHSRKHGRFKTANNLQSKRLLEESRLGLHPFKNLSEESKKLKILNRRKASPLSKEQVILIREEYSKGGISMMKLANKYNVGFCCVRRIVRLISWKDVA